MTSASDDTFAVALATGSLPPTMEGQNDGSAASHTQAETALNAIQELLERNKNNKKSSQSQISPSQDRSFDSTMSVDHNLQLFSELQAIVQNYHVGKEQIPRSGVAGEDIELPHYDGTGPLPEMQRVPAAPCFR
jgi:hypothetical protein